MQLARFHSPRLLGCQADPGNWQARGPPCPCLATGGWAGLHMPLHLAFPAPGGSINKAGPAQ